MDASSGKEVAQKFGMCNACDSLLVLMLRAAEGFKDNKKCSCNLCLSNLVFPLAERSNNLHII